MLKKSPRKLRNYELNEKLFYYYLKKKSYKIYCYINYEEKLLQDFLLIKAACCSLMWKNLEELLEKFSNFSNKFSKLHIKKISL